MTRHVSPEEIEALRVVALDSVFDLSRQRAPLVLPGTTIAGMVEAAYPGLPAARRDILQATVNGHVIPSEIWHSVRPKPGTTIVFKPIPGDDFLRTALTIAVTVAAIAAGQFYAPALLGAIGVGATATTTAVASAAITATTLLAGTLLINALVPPRSDKKDQPSYSISGLQNQLTPDGVIPLILGKVRYAPPYAARPFTSSVGEERYVTAAFLCGYGRLAMRDWCIGQTPIGRFKDVEFESRDGVAGDARLALYPKQVIEEALSIELKAAASPTGGPNIRTTALDVTGAEIDIAFPGGVFLVNSDGEYENHQVEFTVRIRKAGLGDDAWIAQPNISVVAKITKAFTRTTPIAFTERGRWEIELTRLTRDWDDEEQKKKKRSGRSAWAVLRSFRPEYPIAFDKPLALAACRIRATGQLNGVLDSLNAEMSSICPDWNAATSTWITRETNNPASLFRYVLTGPAITYPLSTADVTALGDWHVFCAAKGLTYNRAHDYEASVYEVLADVAAAGRASPQDAGTLWGAVIDRALDFVSAHISPKNSWGFSGERPYVIYPDAFRVTFLDETNRFEKAERIVPWPGFTGTPSVIEKLEMPGVTNPAMIWKEARRRQYELINRADTYVVNQDIESLTVVRGDRVQLNHDVLDRVQASSRVKAVQGSVVALDDVVTLVAGTAYACRFRRDDGTSLTRTVANGSGETSVLTLTGVGDMPDIGNLALFGTAGSESLACTVKGIEAMENFTARLTLIDHAPQIEALVDAEVPPVWSGRAGGEAQAETGTPLAPTITEVVSGHAASDQATQADPYPIIVAMRDTPVAGVAFASHEVQSRIAATTSWSAPVSAPAAAGSVTVRGYAKGAQVELQARTTSTTGVVGPWSASTTHTVAAADPGNPTNLAVTIERRAVNGSQTLAFLRLVCTAPTRDDLVLAGRYRPVGATAWTSMTADSASAYSLTSASLIDATQYEVQGELTTRSGTQESGWLAASGSPITATADPTAPAAPTYSSATLNAGTGGVTHAFKQSPSANARSIELRRAQGFGKVVADAAVVASGVEAANQNDTLADTIDLGLYLYWLRALNGSGVASPDAGPLSVLQAPQRGNVLTAPYDLTNAAWTKTQVTASLSGTGPDGQATTLLSETAAATVQHQVTQSYTGPAGKYRAAFGLKIGGGRTRALLYLYDATLGSNVRVTVDISAGTIAAVNTTGSVITGGTASLIRVSADTYIVTLTGTFSTANPVTRLFILNDSGAQTYTGDTTKGLLVWGGTLAPAA